MYDLTGIDVDGRRETVSKMIPLIDKRITNFLKFSQSLPGFSEISVADQLLMIDGTFSKAWN